MEAPRIQNMFEDYEYQGVMVLAVGYHESVQTCIEWKDRHFLTHPVLSDPTGSVTLQYVPTNGGIWLPHSVIVDTTHIVLYTEAGYNDTTTHEIFDSLLTPEIFIDQYHLDFGTVIEGLLYRQTIRKYTNVFI